MNYSSLNTSLNTLTSSSNLDTMASSSTDVIASVSAILGAFLGVIIVVAIVLCVLKIIAWWKIFTKAGEKGWKAIIPIYNLVIAFKISGTSPWLILLYLLTWIPVVGVLIAIALLIYYSNNLAKSFGKDIGYTVGLVVPETSWIFELILAFSNAEYVGPARKTAQTEETF